MKITIVVDAISNRIVGVWKGSTVAVKKKLVIAIYRVSDTQMVDAKKYVNRSYNFVEDYLR